MAKKIQLGMVGYGFRGPGLLKLASGIDSFEPVAVCSARTNLVDRVRPDFQDIAVFNDYQAMLDSGKVQAVLIETPPATHADYAIAALERNIHVLSDVPAIHRLDEAEPLWAAAQKSKAVYMFGSNANYWEFVSQLSEIKDKGLLGKPFYMEAEYVHDITEFAKATPWRQGYEPIRYCTHSLGPTLQWLDDELVDVSCMDTGSHVYPQKEGHHDAMVALFRSRSNAVVKLTVCFTNALPFGMHRYLCHGTEGYFDCTWPLIGCEPEVRFCSKKEKQFEQLTTITVSSDSEKKSQQEDISNFNTVDHAMLKDFVQAIDGGLCKLDLKQGLRMTIPGLYAIESAKQGGKLVKITYPWE